MGRRPDIDGSSPAEVLDGLLEMASWLAEGMSADAAGRGLTMARAELVWVLARRGPMRQRDLADALRVTPRNITGLLDALEKAGFVRRNPHPTDGRAVLVELTDAGRSRVDALVADHAEFAGFLFAGLPEADLACFGSVVAAILDRLRGAGFPEMRAAALSRWEPPGAGADSPRCEVPTAESSIRHRRLSPSP